MVWHTQVKYDCEIPFVQVDFQFISGVAVWCPEAHAKATVLTMVDMETRYVGVLMVSGKDIFICGRAQHWRERNHVHERAAERSQISAIQS